MRFSFVPVLALLASLAAAQGPNAFNIPSGGFTGFAAGKSSTLNWSNPQGSTVTLMLRQGTSTNLGSGTTIASKIPNKGSYTWHVPSNIVAGSDYAIEIIDDDDTNLINFTPQFAISSPNTASSSANTASMTSSASSSGSASASNSAMSSMSTSGSSSTTGGATPSASGGSSSASPANNAAPAVQVGGSLLAVGFAFAAAL